MRLCGQPAQRDIDGASDVLVLVVLLREHLDELSALGHELLHVVATDLDGRHQARS